MQETSDTDAKVALDQFLANNPELEQLSAAMATFNIFRALKIEDVEIRHSNTLGWLLNPTESHGLGDVFLRRILSNILLKGDPIEGLSAAHVEMMDLTDVEVRREWQNKDVLVIIRSEPNVVLLIENKIRSGEGKGQLARYRREISQEFPLFRLVPVFLTLEGQASVDGEASSYINYSHAQSLAVLEQILKQRRSQLPEAVSTFLDHYMDTLRRLTMQDENLIKLCKAIYRRHEKAINLIVDYGKVSVFEHTVNDVLVKDGHNEVLYSTPREVWFIPELWSPVIPENGIPWTHLKRPISVACWFDRGENRVRVVFEVSRMNDPKLRMACVKKLSAAGFKLTKKAFSEDATYSRFHHFTHQVSDMNDENKVRDAVQEVLAKAKEQFPRVQAVLADVFKGMQA